MNRVIQRQKERYEAENWQEKLFELARPDRSPDTMGDTMGRMSTEIVMHVGGADCLPAWYTAWTGQVVVYYLEKGC